MHNKRAIWSADSIIIYSKLSLTSVIIPGAKDAKYNLAKSEARKLFEIVSDNFGKVEHPALMD